MAISLEIINVGVENQATGSDSLYTAFNKTQNNFAILSNAFTPDGDQFNQSFKPVFF